VPSVVSLAAARADVIVTHFEPTAAMMAQAGGEPRAISPAITLNSLAANARGGAE
jgi:hypothetical protein